MQKSSVGNHLAIFKHYRNGPVFGQICLGKQCRPRSDCSSIRVYTVCHSVCIVWTHYSMVEPHSSNFRVITTNLSGVRIFRKFTVLSSFLLQSEPGSSLHSKDSDEPGHPPSLIRVFAVRMKKHWIFSYPVSAQRRL